jgi:hypothetical protein
MRRKEDKTSNKISPTFRTSSVLTTQISPKRS